MKYFVLLFVLFISYKVNHFSKPIDYFDGQLRIINYNYFDGKYALYDFKKSDGIIKSKYFVKDAHINYLNWKRNKQVLLVTAATFSDNYDVGAKPIGLCIENGQVINRNIKNEWDGIVIVYENQEKTSGMTVIDIANENIKVNSIKNPGQSTIYDIRNSTSDKVNFIDWAIDAKLTMFQTQLLYSYKSKANFKNLNYGEERERRFLAICMKNNIEHQVIIDVPKNIKLNLAASYVKTILEYDGFGVSYILNLDTGDKNLLYAYNGTELENLNPCKCNFKRTLIENATNLLVFYKEY